MFSLFFSFQKFVSKKRLQLKNENSLFYVTLTNESDLEAVISLDCQEFNGRKLFINKDHDNFHLKRFVEKIGGLSFKLDEYGDPVIRFCGLFLVKVGHTYDAQDLSGP